METLGRSLENVVTVETEGRTLAQVLMEVERRYLEQALTDTGGNKTKAAARAGVSLTTLREKLAKFTVKAVFSLE